MRSENLMIIILIIVLINLQILDGQSVNSNYQQNTSNKIILDQDNDASKIKVINELKDKHLSNDKNINIKEASNEIISSGPP